MIVPKPPCVTTTSQRGSSAACGRYCAMCTWSGWGPKSPGSRCRPTPMTSSIGSSTSPARIASYSPGVRLTSVVPSVAWTSGRAAGRASSQPGAASPAALCGGGGQMKCVVGGGSSSGATQTGGMGRARDSGGTFAGWIRGEAKFAAMCIERRRQGGLGTEPERPHSRVGQAEQLGGQARPELQAVAHEQVRLPPLGEGEEVGHGGACGGVTPVRIGPTWALRAGRWDVGKGLGDRVGAPVEPGGNVVKPTASMSGGKQSALAKATVCPARVSACANGTSGLNMPDPGWVANRTRIGHTSSVERVREQLTTARSAYSDPATRRSSTG